MTADSRGPEGPIRAAGAVVRRTSPDGTAQLLAVHRPRYDDWSIPKGKLDAGEPAPVAAVRETFEETGHRVRLAAPAGSTTYQKDGRPKRVDYWLASAVHAEPFVPGSETDAIEWLDLPHDVARLTSASDRAIARSAAAAPHTALLIVARHTAARARPDWPAADPDRPLDENGRQQAMRLRRLLDCWAPERVISSPSTRCVETVAPYAAGRTVELEPVLSEESHAEDRATVAGWLEKLLDGLLDGLRGLTDVTAQTPPLAARHPSALLCTHRPVLPAIADALGIPLSAREREEALPPGGVWVLHVTADGGRTVERHEV